MKFSKRNCWLKFFRKATNKRQTAQEEEEEKEEEEEASNITERKQIKSDISVFFTQSHLTLKYYSL